MDVQSGVQESIGRPGVQSVQRAVQLLEALAAAQSPQTMQSLALKLGCSPSTAHRIAVTLAQGNLLEFNPLTKRYSLGVGIAKLAQRRAEQNDLSSIAQPFMDALREKVLETTSLWTRVGDSKVCVACSDGSYTIRQYLQIGTRVPMADLSAGSRVLLADDRPESVRALVSNWYPDMTNDAISDFVASAAAVRTAGLSLVPEENANRVHPDVATMAAPVFDSSGTIVAALVVAGPVTRFTESAMTRASEAVLGCAHSISAALGAV
ncbi:transcriptional regulator, IclR family [Nocardia nova SH22a]|uniref:Transcriptional regulator, IclR family n=2 Tax=Nocardia nova TaxID=37330 RepID=W5TKQ1_9NOCA|nr:transcriptional regulator, IclR family [Nocardia nova SH22a]